MAAITPTKIIEFDSIVANLISGTSTKAKKIVEITATTTASSNTYDVSLVFPGFTVAYAVTEVIDEAKAAGNSTYSSSTITFAAHAGSGRYRGLFVLEQ